MVSIPKIVGVVSSGGVVLCLSLFNPVLAAERIKSDPCGDRKGGESNLMKCDKETRQGIETIKGEVLHFDRNNVLVQRLDGKEVRLYIDRDTQMTEFIGQGDRIEAKVNNQEDVVSIRLIE